MFNIIKYEQINFIFIEESMKAGESVQTLEYVNVIVIIIYNKIIVSIVVFVQMLLFA